MDNEYYERLSEMNPGDLADGLAIEAEFNAIAQGFSKLPTPHTGGQGFDGPVRVGDAVNPDEAVSKGQLDATLGNAKQLLVDTYGDFNAAAWATLPSGTYLLFGTGSQISNSPFTLAAAKTYNFAVRHAIGSNLYFDSVLMSSSDDSAHVDIGREAWRSGPTRASSVWRAAALKKGAVTPLEALVPAADMLAFFDSAGSAKLVAFTEFARSLMDDANKQEALATLGAVPVTAQIPTGADLNNYKTTGTFQLVTNAVNIPAGAQNYGLLSVLFWQSVGFQTYTNYNNARHWIRSFDPNVSGGTWTGWAEVYTQARVVGSVAQSGGVPTGAIIERGSNANGYYVKLADGTVHIDISKINLVTPITLASGNIFITPNGSQSIIPLPITLASTADMTVGAHQLRGSNVWITVAGVVDISSIAVFFGSSVSMTYSDMSIRVGVNGRWY